MGIDISVLIYACLGALSLLIIAWRSNMHGKMKTTFPPGPFAWPVIGNLHLLLTHLPHQVLRDLSRKYGPIMGLRLGQQLAVAISSPELAKEVLHTHDKIFANRPPFQLNELLLYGQNSDILFSAHCPKWRKLRKLCTVGLFTTKRLQDLEYVRREEMATLLFHIQAESAGATKAVDIGRCVGRMSSHVVMRLLKSDASVQAGAENLHNLVKELKYEVSSPTLRDVLPALSWLDFTRKRRRMCRLHDRVDAALSAVLARRKEAMSTSSYDDLLQSLLSKLEMDEARKNSPQEDTVTLEDIKCILLDMLAAGIHTTSLTLEWAMAELLNNPQCLERLRSEIDATLGKRTHITDEDIPKLSYLKCVVKEVARLHPVVPTLLPRFSTEACTIKGYTIPAKTLVFVNVWAISRDEQVWRNAQQFRPERFEEKDVDMRGQHYELLPFGSGRRICLGLPLALSILHVTLANLVNRFDWELPLGETLNMEEKTGLNMEEKTGLTASKATPTMAIPKPRAFLI